ncbi:MAG: hypothetical protein KGY74_10540, partial [Candidatus Cloacimonetes bacterium]|nr:hypothetical protein [Candidatus Cloacimonadota bacterium]
MGTQQILLIVLSVIIVGIAVAVGITMFQSQAVNQNRQAIIADMNNMASEAMAYYKTPTSHGGAGSPSGWNATDVTLGDLESWLSYKDWTSATDFETDNGYYALSTTTDSLVISGVGTEDGNAGSITWDKGQTPTNATDGNVAAELTVSPTGNITT